MARNWEAEYIQGVKRWERELRRGIGMWWVLIPIGILAFGALYGTLMYNYYTAPDGTTQGVPIVDHNSD